MKDLKPKVPLVRDLQAPHGPDDLVLHVPSPTVGVGHVGRFDPSGQLLLTSE